MPSDMTMTPPAPAHPPAPAPAPAPARGGARSPTREGLPAMLLLAPFLIAFLLFFAVPAFETLYLSLTESSLTRTNAFVGLDNYHLLLNDPSFWDSVGNTFMFAL